MRNLIATVLMNILQPKGEEVRGRWGKTIMRYFIIRAVHKMLFGLLTLRLLIS